MDEVLARARQFQPFNMTFLKNHTVEQNFVSPLNYISSEGKNLEINSNYVIGRLVWALQPVRIFNTKGKGRYSISFVDYPFNVYPPFPAGQGYIISKSAVPLIYLASFYVPASLRHLDDVFLGLLVHFSNERKNGEFVGLVDDNRFGNEDRRFDVRKSKWDCEQLNFHRFNVTADFLKNRNKQCGKIEQSVTDDVDHTNIKKFGPPENFRRNFVIK